MVTGDFPWEADDSTTESKRRSLQRKLSILALDIRAAQIDKQLVGFEIDSFQRSMQQRCSNANKLIADASQQLQQLLQQQDDLLAVIDCDAADDQRYARCCDLRACEIAAKQQCARLVILRKQLSSLLQQQQQSERLFEQYSAGHPAAAAAAAAVEQCLSPVDDGQAEDACVEDTDSDDDGLEPEWAPGQGLGATAGNAPPAGQRAPNQEDQAAAAAVAGAAAAGDEPVAAAAAAATGDEATTAAGVVEMEWESAPSFSVLSGTAPNNPWGSNMVSKCMTVAMAPAASSPPV